ncbi:DUF58 domain-containing protein [Solicola sp. PLA-1-18]|uniref:DUF58 domain-containing protein n=1 Tax=Solicola sp. PLA-1-18 TaxID=3380532 RepID=UPI003B80E8A5
MRDALLALTVRGRAFVAAGLTTTVCAVLLGFDALMRVGVLAVALPVLTAFWVGRARYQLRAARRVEPGRVAMGSQARVRLDLVNEGRLPAGMLMFEERLPKSLGRPLRFTVEQVKASWHRTLEYTVEARERGHHPIGPLSVRVGDPFGFIALTRTFHTTNELVVTPRVWPLDQLPSGASPTQSGEARVRNSSSGSAEDVTVREYRRGDDLRRVHWPSTARLGELMVRREERNWQNRATVVLDTRAGAHTRLGPDSSLEWAISAAASVVVHLDASGHDLRLLTERAAPSTVTWHERTARGSDVAGLVLDQLAAAQASDIAGIRAAVRALAEDPGLVVAVLGSLDLSDLEELSSTTGSRTRRVALLCDVDAWSGTPRHPSNAEQRDALRRAGWTVAVASPGSHPGEVWRAASSVSERVAGVAR